MSLKILIGSFFVISTALTILFLANSYPEFKACLNDSENNDADCLLDFVMATPQVEEATDLKSACNETSSNCFAKIATKGLEKKTTES